MSFWVSVRVIGTFVVLIVAFFFLLTYGPIVDVINLGDGLAWLAAVMSWAVLYPLGLVLGWRIDRSGTVMNADGFLVDVGSACSGVVPTIIYLAAVLAYPAPWRAKLLGAGIGAGVIHLVNVARVIALFLIGLYFNDFFHQTHVYVAQALVICVAVALWMYWAARTADAASH